MSPRAGPPLGRGASLARVGTAYVVALVAAAGWLAAGPSTGRLWLDTLLADVLATLVVFGFSRFYRNSSLYDAYWSVVPPAVVLYWWSQAEDTDPARMWLLTAVVVVWAVRLTTNWVIGFPGLHHEDWRYPLLRERAGRAELLADLFGIHLVPTVQVFLGLLPAYVVAFHATDPFGPLDVLAVLAGLAAVALEWVADSQMRRFVARREPGAVMDQGLWAWSRHPNYFGELLFWVAVALFGVAAAPAQAWWLFAGAVAMLAMLQLASIPMMEQRSLERRPSYQRVIDRVPRFVPLPPRRRAREEVA